MLSSRYVVALQQEDDDARDHRHDNPGLEDGTQTRMALGPRLAQV
jgi:hypothetical protein